MELFLVRHGITRSNRDGVYAGRNDESILPEASKAVAQVTGYLNQSAVTRIYSSPLTRALETSRPLAESMSCTARQVADLTEMDFGEWTSMTGDEIVTRCPDTWRIWRSDPYMARVPGGEGLTEVQDRACAWVKGLSRHAPNRVAVFTHEAVIKTIICAISPLGNAMYRKAVVENCSVHRLNVTPGQVESEWTIHKTFAPGRYE